jgi:hypothetical protein
VDPIFHSSRQACHLCVSPPVGTKPDGYHLVAPGMARYPPPVRSGAEGLRVGPPATEWRTRTGPREVEPSPLRTSRQGHDFSRMKSRPEASNRPRTGRGAIPIAPKARAAGWPMVSVAPVAGGGGPTSPVGGPGQGPAARGVRASPATRARDAGEVAGPPTPHGRHDLQDRRRRARAVAKTGRPAVVPPPFARRGDCGPRSGRPPSRRRVPTRHRDAADRRGRYTSGG